MDYVTTYMYISSPFPVDSINCKLRLAKFHATHDSYSSYFCHPKVPLSPLVTAYFGLKRMCLNCFRSTIPFSLLLYETGYSVLICPYRDALKCLNYFVQPYHFQVYISACDGNPLPVIVMLFIWFQPVDQ